MVDHTGRPAADAGSPLPARVRFAPSPTGFLHLGGLRTALFDWLWARHTGGAFILRIEDTDQKRLNPQSMADLMRSLRWLGLDWDEGPDVGGPYGPYIQSQRKAIYARYADELLQNGSAYRCYCTPERLEAVREEQRQQKRPMAYDRHCRSLSPAQQAANAARGLTSTMRLKVPLEGVTHFHDLVRGTITTANHELQDAVLLKSDGMPTYHLAMVVDDHLMEITHILRGEEWLASAPLHQLLFDAFGWQLPLFVHLPVILDPSGKGKMSKRRIVVDGKEYLALVHEFIDAGYLPEALFNLLANVGWSFDAEREVFSREEAIARFDLAAINPSPAAMPYSKLDWLNGLYIRELDPADLQERLLPFLSRGLGIGIEQLRADPKVPMLVPLIRERLKTLAEAPQLVDWAFVDAGQITYPDPTQLIGRKLDTAQGIQVLERGLALLKSSADFSPGALEESFRAAADAMTIKVGSFFAPFRVAITGRTVAPPLFESMAVLGRDEVLRRVTNGLAALRAFAAETAA